MSSERALRTRRRATHGSSGQQDDGAAENEKDEKGPKSFHLEQPIATETKSDEPPKATTGSRLRDRMRSPMLGSMKLDDLKDQISKSVEVKQVCSLLRENLVDETAAVAFWAVAMPLCLFLFLVLMSFPPFWPILIPYCVWIQFDKSPDWGGFPKQWARKMSVWKYFAQYYPCSIVKEADLSPDRSYIFGYHPHGIIGMGAFATFATEGTGFSELFPGITPHLLTLESNFRVPFYREFLMLHGLASVAKPACHNILKKGPGQAITIVVGGAAESLSAHPGTADLTLKKRYGFVKVAIKRGAALVPVFSFGENDIYEQMPNQRGSIIWKVQTRFQHLFGFTLPLFYGRGLFNYNYGLMPFRHPIVSVVGKPIITEQNSNPSEELIQEYQTKYIEELMSIWNKYKDVYARNRTKELTLVE